MGGLTWLNILNPVTNLFKRKPNPEIQAIQEADHAYVRGHETQRSPCPFLNALANQNYLYALFRDSQQVKENLTRECRPRDGKNITQAHLKAALIVAGNSSSLFADVFASIVKPILHKDGTFTLVDLRRHNAIEHDASFTRLDYRQGDNYTFQPAMFQALLADANGGPITKDSLARTRVRRDKEEKQAGHGAGLTFFSDPKLWITMWSQTCVLLQTFGERISVDDITMFYEQEKLPEWWLQDASAGRRRMTFVGQLRDIAGVFWRHLFVKVPDTTLNNPLKGW